MSHVVSGPHSQNIGFFSLPDGINRMSQRLMRAAEYLVKGGLLSGEKEGKGIDGLTESRHD